MKRFSFAVTVGVFVLSFLLSSCGALSPREGTFDDLAYGMPTDQAGGFDLFDTSTTALTEVEIALALDTPCELAEEARIAIVHIGHDSELSGYRYESLIGSASEALDVLTATDRIASAAYLPGFILPRELTLADLREAAARFQADALLLVDTTLRLGSDWRPLVDDEVFGTLVLECALLDTRTGLVLWAHRLDADVEGKLDLSGDRRADEVRRFERTHMAAGMLKLAEVLDAYLEADAD